MQVINHMLLCIIRKVVLNAVGWHGEFVV